tara:strand:+ start:431 stop:568 length:138 start_codon:yes stop_codon:yes gene_type:complete
MTGVLVEAVLLPHYMGQVQQVKGIMAVMGTAVQRMKPVAAVVLVL